MIGVGLNLFVVSTGRRTRLSGPSPIEPSKPRAVFAGVFVLVGLACIVLAVVTPDSRSF